MVLNRLFSFLKSFVRYRGVPYKIVYSTQRSAKVRKSMNRPKMCGYHKVRKGVIFVKGFIKTQKTDDHLSRHVSSDPLYCVRGVSGEIIGLVQIKIKIKKPYLTSLIM